MFGIHWMFLFNANLAKNVEKKQPTRCAFKVSSKFHQTLKCPYKVWSNFESSFQSLIKLWRGNFKVWSNFEGSIPTCLQNFALNKNIQYIPDFQKIRFQHKPCLSDMKMLTLRNGNVDSQACTLRKLEIWNDMINPQKGHLRNGNSEKGNLKNANSQKWKLLESLKSEMDPGWHLGERLCREFVATILGAPKSNSTEWSSRYPKKL